MKIEDGKIVEATEEELWDYWYTRQLFEIYPFDEYIRKMEWGAGVKIIRKGCDNK